jgi:hypothetical protein
MITADQLVAHAVGDYILQSDWMANEKTKRSLVAFIHAWTYSLPFLFLTHSAPAMAIIMGTHFVIDRWRLARYVCWSKNWLAPRWAPRRYLVIGAERQPLLLRNYSWAECSDTGYHNEKPQWLTVWLMIITDNLMHVLINGMALKYL